MNNIELLQKLDLNGRQAKVYVELLRLGSASAIELAKATGYKHPTVYDVLDILKERALISESFQGNRKRFTAEDPIRLQVAEQERQNIIDLLMPDLQALYSARANRPLVRFYHGEAGMLEIHRQMLNTPSKEYFYFGSVKEMYQVTSAENNESYYHERIKRGVRSYALRVRSGEVDLDYMKSGEENLREVRYLPEDITGEVPSLYLFDGTVAIVSGSKENYGMTITSTGIFSLLKSIWLCMWKNAEIPART